MSINRVTISYVGYENKSENVEYEKVTKSLSLGIGGQFVIEGPFPIGRVDRKKQLQQIGQLVEYS